MRLFKTPSFQRDFGKSELGVADLRVAMDEISRGLVDATLGGELVKKRVARAGAGKSGGYRTIIAVRFGDRAVFLHLFAKSEKANTDRHELAALKTLAKHYLTMTSEALNTAVAKGALLEIDDV